MVEAVAHVNRYGTHHSEAIVATDEQAIDEFLATKEHRPTLLSRMGRLGPRQIWKGPAGAERDR